MINHTNYQQGFDAPVEYIMADRLVEKSLSNRPFFDSQIFENQTFINDIMGYYGADLWSKTSVSNYRDFLIFSGTTSLIINVAIKPKQTIGERQVESYLEIVGMSVSDQAREALAALSINKSQLAEILDVSRPTLYSWFDGSNPNPGNSDRLLKLLKLLRKTGIQGTSPLNTRFVRQPLNENDKSLIELLKSDSWNEDKLTESLAKARDLSIQDAQRNEDKNKRFKDLGYEEVSLSERKKRLEINTSIVGWNSGNDR